MIPMVVLFILFVGVVKLTTFDPDIASWIFFGTLAIYLILSQIIVSRKLKELEMDSSYMKKYFISRAISYCGLAVFIVSIVTK